MRLIATLFLLAALLLAPAAHTRAYTLQYTNTSATTQVRWPVTNITVALSSSLNNPPAYVRATGAQVVLAARRALSRWALASNIQFNVTTSNNQDAVADGVSLITIADTGGNQALFSTGVQPGRARVNFDGAGNISEADLAINPLVTRLDAFGNQIASFFSTDGTADSYDLESTFVHEIGHMLGLEHSGVVAASMQPRQGTNGTYNLPNFTTRTLSSDDVAGIRAIYGPRTGLGEHRGARRLQLRDGGGRLRRARLRGGRGDGTRSSPATSPTRRATTASTASRPASTASSSSRWTSPCSPRR